MKRALSIFLIVFVMILLCGCNLNTNSAVSSLTDSNATSGKVSWKIKYDKTFEIEDTRKDKNEPILDGYYVMEGNDKFCFEIRGNKARWSEDLDEYKQMQDSEIRKLVIFDYTYNNVEKQVGLSFEGKRQGYCVLKAQEFISIEKGIFRMAVYTVETTESNSIPEKIFKRQSE